MAKRRRVRRRRTVARSAPKRRRRRRSNPVARANPPRRRRRTRRRRNPVTAISNPRRRRRRRSGGYRRNPSFSVRGILAQAKAAGFTAVQIVGGKVATRIVRNYIPGGKPAAGQPLTPMQILIELGAATLVGYAGSMFLGARVGANLMAGGFVGVVESLVKTYQIPLAADALADDGDPNVVQVPSSMGGYVRDLANRPDLAGYVQDSARINGPGLGEPYGSSGVINDGSGIFEEAGVGF